MAMSCRARPPIKAQSASRRSSAEGRQPFAPITDDGLPRHRDAKAAARLVHRVRSSRSSFAGMFGVSIG